MNVITVASPDKISLNMFHSYLIGNPLRGKKVTILPLNSLTSVQRNDAILKENLDCLPDGSVLLILYKVKKGLSLEDMRCLRSSFFEKVSHIVFTLDLYAVTPRVLKDRFEDSKAILAGWQTFVDRVEKS